MNKFRNLIIVLAFTVVFAVSMTGLLERVFSNLEWAFLGLTFVSFCIVADFFIRFVPGTFPCKQPIFTNVRDTIIVILSLLTGSAIAYVPEWTGNENFVWQLLAHSLAAIFVIAVISLFGTTQLRGQIMRNSNGNPKKG